VKVPRFLRAASLSEDFEARLRVVVAGGGSSSDFPSTFFFYYFNPLDLGKYGCRASAITTVRLLRFIRFIELLEGLIKLLALTVRRCGGGR
jgi:hypothetical protein